MKLIAVESPHKAKVIQGFLGGGYKVLPTVGHFKEMPIPKNMTPAQKEKYGQYAMDIDNDFDPLYKTISGSQKTIKAFKEQMKKADELIIATDSDNEGALIGLLLIEELKPKIPTYRATWNEITRSAIDAGLKAKQRVDTKKREPKAFFNAAESARTRASWDRLYGFSTSPLVWKWLKPGLALHEDTLIPMSNNKNTSKADRPTSSPYYKTMNEVKKGDYILDSMGQPTEVLEKYRTDDESFKITFDSSDEERTVKASGGHLWDVHMARDRLNPITDAGKVNFKDLTSDKINSWLCVGDFTSSEVILKFLMTCEPQMSRKEISELIRNYAEINNLRMVKYIFNKDVARMYLLNKHIDDSLRERLLTSLENTRSSWIKDEEYLFLNDLSFIVWDVLKMMVVSSPWNRQNISNGIARVVIDLGWDNYFFYIEDAKLFLNDLLSENDTDTTSMHERNENGKRTYSTKELYELYKNSDKIKASIPTVVAQYEEVDLSENPYTVGRNILGGSSSTFLPDEYFFTSITQRIELLSGFVDAAAFIDCQNGSIFYSSASLEKISQIRHILESLGIKPLIRRVQRGYVISWSYNSRVRPFTNRAAYKKLFNQMYRHKSVEAETRYITKIEKIPTEGKYFCLKVDSPYSLFLCDSFIATHNSSGLHSGRNSH